MSHIYIMVNVDSTSPPTYSNRGWTAAEETAKSYNDNFVDTETPTNTVKICTHAYDDPDLTGIPERDANDNII